MDEVTGEWRKLHNEELIDLYSSLNIVRVIKSRKNEIGGSCSAFGEEERRIKALVRKPDVKRPPGKRRRR
jgi:hypothetical protein